MTVHAFPALGFDPAPGSPDALGAVARSCGSLSTALLEDSGRLRDLAGSGAWRGPAAEAFRHRLEDLPRDLDRAADAYGQACTAVSRFSVSLREAQLRAVALEQRAEAATDADARAGIARDADRLRDAVRDDAARCGRALELATRHAPHPPSWFHQLVDDAVSLVTAVNDAVGDFVRTHAEVIAGLAAALSKASSLLSVVAMLAGPVPVIGQAVGTLAAGASLLAAGGALVLHTSLAVYAGGSWGAVLTDATAVALGMAPHGVEAAAERIVASRVLTGGEELGEVGMPMSKALSIVRHPKAAVGSMASATMSFPALVTRTVSYQFDLAGGAVGTVDLARIGRFPEELREAGQHAREAQERHDAAGGDPRLVEVAACPS